MKNTNFKIITITLSIFTSLSVAAQELNLACVQTLDRGFETRQVLIGDNHENVIMRVSSSSQRRIQLKQYAVVIDLVPGTGGSAAREEWEVLQDHEFKLQKIRQRSGQPGGWTFTDLNRGDEYTCSPNRMNRANPAITRNN